METKFTKGKWLLETNSESASFINTSTHRIAEAKHYSTIIDDVLLEPTVEEGRANALLISKAPEMFEDELQNIKFFKDFLSCYSDMISLADKQTIELKIKRTEQLLKEATEL